MAMIVLIFSNENIISSINVIVKMSENDNGNDNAIENTMNDYYY